MQSFRQYLNETEKTYYPRFVQLFKIKVNDPKLDRDTAEYLFDKLTDDSLPPDLERQSTGSSLVSGEWKISLTVEAKSANMGSKSAVDTEMEKIKRKIENLPFTQGNKATVNPELECTIVYNMPPFKVSADVVNIGLAGVSAPPKSLHDVHKLVECSKICVETPDRVEGSVLGLLVMKGLKELQLGHQSRAWHKEIPWVQLIDKHFPERDLIGCKEEMIEQGLKEYAKL